MNDLLNEIENNLKTIHYPLCQLEKISYFNESDDVDNEVQNIHKGYMQIQTAINHLRKLKVLEDTENVR